MDRDLEALALLDRACRKSSPGMVAANLRWAHDRYVLSIERAHIEALAEAKRRANG